MKIIEAGAFLINPSQPYEIERALKNIEYAGRTCYKSEDRITQDSARNFVKMLVKNKHDSVLEHSSITCKFVVDRAISHEIVRHRIAAYCQESTRYCNYSKNAFGTQITVIRPYFYKPGEKSYEIWKQSCEVAEKAYFDLLDIGETPEKARSVLPQSLKTELTMTANFREWRHFFKLRAVGESGKPHPQMVQVASDLLRKCVSIYPEVFGDIMEEYNVKGR